MGIFSRVASWEFRHRQEEHRPDSHEMLSTVASLANQSALQLISGQHSTRNLVASAANTATMKCSHTDRNNVNKVELEKLRQLRHGIERYLGLHTAPRESSVPTDSKQLPISGQTKTSKALFNKPPCSHKRYSEHQQEADLGERFDPARRPSTPVAWAIGGTYKRLLRNSTTIRTTKVQHPVAIPPCYASGMDYWPGSFWDDNLGCQARGTPVLNLVPPPEDDEDVHLGKQWADIWPRPPISLHDACDKSLLYVNSYERCQKRSKRQAASTDLSACPTASVPLHVVNQDSGDGSGVQGDEAQILGKDLIGVANPTAASDYITRAKEYPPLTYDGEEWGDELVDSAHYLGTVDEDYRQTTYCDDPTSLAVKCDTYFSY
ncbi:hypothetical protein M0657_005488 [Pyricularia oryzae]|uniref:Uncharacterized protein n=3 Tax=Pyricularia oryzae TaxID=318829 RepID=A0A4P7NCU2_PYROR|nr:hypothetical protein OOU_Y34scaffold00033g21 [Pyricularia oryzae Y34]KAI7919749.1 hypothetical protein M9X92_006229 [Pyricularia oryzae]KAI7922728.1 hypothetical protein M0657_005488 [Pyricularia oryzae]QBZ59692.1 hypothetical protein PoMZ_04655 [Pyricularia oryzae]